MIRIGIVSDSHGYVDRLEQMLRATTSWDLQMWLHCGDYDDDAMVMAQWTDLPIHYVRGNNDHNQPLGPRELLLPYTYGYIYMTHGHDVSYYNHDRALTVLGRDMGANLVVAGHTHCHMAIDDGDVLYVNPGSIALPRDKTKGTFAVVTIDGEQRRVRWYDGQTFTEIQE